MTQWADHVWLLWCIDAKEKVAVLSKEFPDELEVFAPCIWDGIEEIGEIGCGCQLQMFQALSLGAEAYSIQDINVHTRQH